VGEATPVNVPSAFTASTCMALAAAVDCASTRSLNTYTNYSELSSSNVVGVPAPVEILNLSRVP
jgi:hypothetical protein